MLNENENVIKMGSNYMDKQLPQICIQTVIKATPLHW